MSNPKSESDRPSTRRRNAGETARVNSHDLLQGARQLIITHGGHEYRLQVTNSGKLILTK